MKFPKQKYVNDRHEKFCFGCISKDLVEIKLLFYKYLIFWSFSDLSCFSFINVPDFSKIRETVIRDTFTNISRR